MIYLFSKKQMYEKAESFINACFIFSGELYNPTYTNPFLEERTYTIQAQEFYFDLFVVFVLEELEESLGIRNSVQMAHVIFLRGEN